MDDKWTVVQHSGFGYGGKPAFEKGLETRMCRTQTEKNRVIKAGGVLFDYMGAEKFAEKAMYPDTEARVLCPTVRVHSLTKRSTD